jgi:hypothetical protein
MLIDSLANPLRNLRSPIEENPMPDENPGGLSTTAIAALSAVAGAALGFMWQKHRMSGGGTTRGEFGDFSWSIAAQGRTQVSPTDTIASSWVWNVMQGKQNIAGGSASSLGQALAAVGQAVDVAAQI